MANSTESDIERIIMGYNRAKDGADYADSIVCEVDDGDDPHCMVWSNYYGGNFAPSN